MWSMGLLKTMKDPKYVIYSDPKIVMIKDMYPKSKHHFLVISNEEISSIRNVNQKHLSLLTYMQQKAEEYTAKNFPDVNFKYGYHAQPSMNRLHLHVISQDMDSECLKTKKHWNSFTTKFFLNSADIIHQLESDGSIKFPSIAECEKILNRALKCHCCDLVLPNMPKLKQHIRIHQL